jgi:hypothetical protein
MKRARDTIEDGGGHDADRLHFDSLLRTTSADRSRRPDASGLVVCHSLLSSTPALEYQVKEVEATHKSSQTQ